MGKTANKLKNRNAKKTKSKRRKKTWLDEEIDSAKSEVDRLAKRFNIKKKKKTLEEELAEYEASCSASVKNGGTHEKLNKPYQIKFQSDVVPMIWVCSLCGKGYAHDSLGDLFGPYYISSPRKNPEHLCTKESKKKSREPNCELWFHGECLLWAPGIFLEKTRLVNLEEKIHKFWEQACLKPGAAIPVDNNYIHYPCAKNNPTYYQLNEADFSCEHKVSSDPGSPQL